MRATMLTLLVLLSSCSKQEVKQEVKKVSDGRKLIEAIKPVDNWSVIVLTEPSVNLPGAREAMFELAEAKGISAAVIVRGETEFDVLAMPGYETPKRMRDLSPRQLPRILTITEYKHTIFVAKDKARFASFKDAYYFARLYVKKPK